MVIIITEGEVKTAKDINVHAVVVILYFAHFICWTSIFCVGCHLHVFTEAALTPEAGVRAKIE